MFLAFDIGNTSIKTGIFDADNLVNISVFSRDVDPVPDLPAAGLCGVAISSVVPDLTLKTARQIKDRYGLSPFIISAKSRFNLKINYETPETLGPDRVCSAEGAFSIFKKSKSYKSFSPGTFLVSVDLGTATTLNIVGFPGEFIGGSIAPGIKTMINSLKLNTAQLPEIDFSSYKGILGKNTESSIAAGIINSTTGLIEKTFSFLKSELNAKEIITFVTGGNAEAAAPFLGFKFEFEKGLVLKGIKAVYDLNVEK